MLLVANQVAPAVADAGDEHLAALPPDGHHDRGAHVLHVFVEGTHRHDFFVRLHDGPANGRSSTPSRVEVRGEVLAQFARDDLDGLAAGDLAGRLPAHAVGDDADGQVREHLDVDRVFVVLAVVAEQAALADVQRERHRDRLPEPDAIPAVIAPVRTHAGVADPRRNCFHLTTLTHGMQRA